MASWIMDDSIQSAPSLMHLHGISPLSLQALMLLDDGRILAPQLKINLINSGQFLKYQTIQQSQYTNSQGITKIEFRNNLSYSLKWVKQINIIQVSILKNLMNSNQFFIKQIKYQNATKYYYILEDGQIITIDQVKEPSIIPQKAIILDIANHEQMQKLICNVEFKKTLEQFNSQQINLVAIFHLSHQIQEEYYKDFIRQYSNFNHIFCNYYKESNDDICQAHMKIQPLSELLSNFLHQSFPFNFPHIEQQILKPIPKDFQNLNSMFGYVPLFEYVILPIKQSGYRPVQNFSPKVLSQMFTNNQFKNFQQQFLQKVKDHLRLIFLGIEKKCYCRLYMFDEARIQQK